MPSLTHVAEEDRLAALADLDVLDTATEERFDRITRMCARALGVDMAAFNLVARDRQWTKSAVGCTVADMARAHSFCSTTVERSGALVVEDALADPRFRDNPFVRSGEGLRFYAGQPVRAPGGERVGTLCVFGTSPRHFSRADVELLGDLAVWVEEELAADEELERAAQVQRELLPHSVPQVPGYEIAARCVTARRVGGDLYDWYAVDDTLTLTLADVMGKGISAAIVSASLRAVLRAATRHGGLPAAVEFAGESLAADFQASGAYATLFHARLDPIRGELCYVDAGHGLSFVVRADGCTTRLPATGVPAGILPRSTWREERLQLTEGDTVVASSDGLLDVHGGPDQLGEAVRSAVCTARSAADVVQRLLDPVRSLPRLDDDATVVVLQRRGARAGEEHTT